MRIVICQRCGCERGPRGGAGPLREPPAGRELLGSVEQVGEAVQRPTCRPGLKEARRGPQEAPGGLLLVWFLPKQPAPTVVLMESRVVGQI